MTDNRIPPSALAPASAGPLLADAELEATARLIIGQVLAAHLSAFEGGSLLWANVERSRVTGEVVDEEIQRLKSLGEPAPMTRERLLTYLTDALGRKLTEQVNRPGAYEFDKGAEGSFVGWVREISRKIVNKAGPRINGYERRTVAVIDGAATVAAGREVDPQHRANRIVNTAVTSGRPTTLAADISQGDPCEIVARNEALGSLTPADWCDVIEVAHKQVPNAHKPLVDAMVYLRSQGIETPNRPIHPDDRAMVRSIHDEPTVAGACVAVLQEKALLCADDEPLKVTPDADLLATSEADIFREMWSTLGAASTRFLASHPERATWVAKRLTFDRPNRGVGALAKMQTLGRRACRRLGVNAPQSQWVSDLIESYAATETEPFPQHWRGGTEEERQAIRVRHGKMRRSFGQKMARVANIPGEPFGDEAQILHWLHSIALASGVIETNPFATRLDLDAVIGDVMGMTG